MSTSPPERAARAPVRCVAAVAIASALSLTSPAAAAEPGVLDVREHRPLAFVLLAPSGRMATTSRSELIRLLSVALGRSTDLTVEAIDAALVADCAGELGCMVAKVDTSGGRVAAAELLLVASIVGREGKRDRLSATLVDAKTARVEYARVSREDPDWRLLAEAAITERAVRATMPWRELDEDASGTVEHLVGDVLRPALEDAGRWEPWGELVLSNLGPGWGIDLDGATIGTTSDAATTRIVGVSAGARRLQLVHAHFEPVDVTLTVERGKTTRYDAAPIHRGGASSSVRTGVIWGGAAVAAAGAAVLTWSLARADGDVVVYCLRSAGATCEASSRFQTSSYDPSAVPAFDDRVNPSGLRVAPLGYALVGTGAVWSLGALLLTDEGEIPWPEVVAGIAVGALAYGLSAALDADSAFATP
ncbi:hypothetical protein L6R52_35105 [Myxococcota bacterium]|nr:hypothetical protein [Myxococcota bacterium]